MNEQAKILRVFKLISVLKKRPRSVNYLSNTFEVSSRTVYRYLTLLENLGFIIDKDFNDNYFIANYDVLNETLDFTQEEAQLVSDLVETGANKHPLKDTIIKKLFTHSDIKHISSEIITARAGLLIRKLRMALDNNHQVVLEKYHSANSGNIVDRLVEVVSFSNDYESLYAFEVASQTMKTFKISRISSVHELEVLVKHQKQHTQLEVDIFGMSGTPQLSIELELSFQAYLLIIKEFPLSVNYLTLVDPETKCYLLSCKVSHFAGVGRFVLGLIDQIKVVKSGSFKTFLNAKLSHGF